MPSPIIKQGTFALTGSKMKVPMGHEPEVILSFTESAGNAKPWLLWTDSAWCHRAGRMEASDSLAQAVRPSKEDRNLRIGTDALMNVAGGTLHYLSMKSNRSDVVNNTNWMGHSEAGVVAPWSPKVGQKKPDFLIIKRDSSYAPCGWARGMPAGESVVFDGTGVITNGVLGVNDDGSINLGTAPNVNNIPAPPNGSIGEGHDCLALFEQTGLVEVKTWLGDDGVNKAAPGSQHTVAAPVGAIVLAHAATTKGGFKLASMGTKMAHAGSTTLIDGAIVSLDGAINIGADNRYNKAGVRYYAVIIGASDVPEVRDRIKFPPNIDPGEILLRGSSTSHINCGNSNILSLAGPHSVGWRGKIRWSALNGAVGPVGLITRALGDAGRADSDGLPNGLGTRRDGTHSHGIYAFRATDISDWVPQFIVTVGDYFNPLDNSGGENDIRTKPWRTGIPIVFNVPTDVRYTTDGNGLCHFYKNRRLLKQRLIDLSQVTISDDAGTRKNGGAGLGHITVFGGYADTAGAIQGIGEQVIYGGDFHSKMLNQDEVDRLYYRLQLGDLSYADVAPVERWQAKDASGTSFPAMINSALNGTITSGARGKFGQF